MCDKAERTENTDGSDFGKLFFFLVIFNVMVFYQSLTINSCQFNQYQHHDVSSYVQVCNYEIMFIENKLLERAVN